jgi:hypothetical protein
MFQRKKREYHKSDSKKLHNLFSLCFFVVLFFFSGSNLTTAQLETPLSIKASSNSPQPEQTIILTAESFSLNTESAFIMWSVNGRERLSGIGENTLSLKLGRVGEKVLVSVVATGANGTLAQSARSFIPSEVTLIWEADTYTPPLYKGKARFTSGSVVRFIALPTIVENGRLYQSKELLFTWKESGKTLGTHSGIGKNTLIFPGPFLGGPLQISIEVQSPTESILARAIVRIEPDDPKILLYEQTPLSGIYFAHAYENTFQLERPEVSFEAYPYFFSFGNRNSSRFNYTWRVDGSTVDPVGRVSSITLRKGEGRGIIPLSLEVENVRELLQQASFKLNIVIGESAQQ